MNLIPENTIQKFVKKELKPLSRFITNKFKIIIDSLVLCSFAIIRSMVYFRFLNPNLPSTTFLSHESWYDCFSLKSSICAVFRLVKQAQNNIVGVHIKVLERMYQKRLRGYAELGYQAQGAESDEKTGIIFDGKNFYSQFSQDIQNIIREAFIINAPYIIKVRR